MNKFIRGAAIVVGVLMVIAFALYAFGVRL